MSLQTVSGTLASAVANGGTVAISYPGGATQRGLFSGGTNHRLVLNHTTLVPPADITLSFGASSVTVTNGTGAAWAAGSSFVMQFDELGSENAVVDATSGLEIYKPTVPGFWNLGSPGVADADGYCASQSVSSGVASLINGALTASSVGTADARYGRNVVAAWTNTAIATVTGKDCYGRTVVEQSASGTSLAGKKAFKTITAVTFNANVTGATVGTGDVLGLPAFLPNATYIFREMEDGATATAGTVVAGLSLGTESTATTADVRGTYDPNSACDGSKGFVISVEVPDPAYLGNPQFAG